MFLIIRVFKVCSVLFLPISVKLIDFAHHCGFCLPRLYILFSPMEQLFEIAIIFAITVSICYKNEFFKVKLTTNLVF